MATTTKRYNGWKNRETWNVALWIGNDEGLYRLARECVRADRKAPYARFVEQMRESGHLETPDGVAYNDSGLDARHLDRMMRELDA